MIERFVRSPFLLVGAFILSALIGAGGFWIAQSWSSGGMERGQVERIVHAYLLEHPEVLPEAMDKLRARETARADEAATAAIRTDGPKLVTPFASAWTGSAQPDVSVVAFLDYNCGYCRANIPALAALIQADPKVRIVYREYPVLGDASVLAARWALAAAQQGKFKAFHDALYSGERLSQASLDAAILRAGIDRGAGQAALTSDAVEQELAANFRLGRNLQVSGTPAFVIGNRRYEGVLTLEELQRAVSEARAGR